MNATTTDRCDNVQTNTAACNYIGDGFLKAPAMCSPHSWQLERGLARPLGWAFFHQAGSVADALKSTTGPHLDDLKFFPGFCAITGVLKMRLSLSSKGRFAVTAMIDIALRQDSGPVPLTDIASRHPISLSYLEQLFSKLRLQGLVTSIRGPGGGYALGHRSDEITVADIIIAVEDSSHKKIRQDASLAQDLTQDLWDTLNANVLDFTQSVTLKSLALDQVAKGVKIERKPAPNRGVFKIPVKQTIGANVPNSVFALGQQLAPSQVFGWQGNDE